MDGLASLEHSPRLNDEEVTVDNLLRPFKTARANKGIDSPRPATMQAFANLLDTLLGDDCETDTRLLTCEKLWSMATFHLQTSLETLRSRRHLRPLRP